MRAIGIIPARLTSTRLARKVLLDLEGQPVLWHVDQQSSKARELDKVLIATDSDEVRQVAESWGASVLMTSPSCSCGTERIASIVAQLQADIILNIQADEPFIDPQILNLLVEKLRDGNCDIATPVFRITDSEKLSDPNLVKVARSGNGRALYFSRSPIPYVRDIPKENWAAQHAFWGHIGVYGFKRHVLVSYHSLPSSSLEAAESLEQLRFLEAGYHIDTVVADYEPFGIDTPEDLEQAANES